MTKTLVFIGIMLLHWIVQFVAWSEAARSAFMRILWGILGVPLVLLCGSITNQYFWLIATANSILWAVVWTYVLFRYVLGKGGT
jgi:hypothetical protein